jgi:hypothetical protein
VFDPPLESDAGHDAATDAGPRDAGRDAAVIDVPRCDDAELPVVEYIGAPIARTFHGADPLATVLPERDTVLFAGGYERHDPSWRMGFVDFEARGERPLAVALAGGSSVLLPLRDGAVVHDARRRRTIVFGGTTASGPSARVFEVTGRVEEGATLSPRYLPSFPAGPLTGAAAIVDPAGDRAIVIGSAGGAPSSASFDLARGVWDELALGGTPSGEAHAMGYDPRTHRAIAVFIEPGSGGASVFALPLDPGSEEWRRIGELDFVPTERGELVFDPEACGFHLLTAIGGCRLEHSFLVVEGDSARAVSTGPFELVDYAGGGSALFSAASNRLWIFGARECSDPEVATTDFYAMQFDR